MSSEEIQQLLLDNLTDDQRKAVRSGKRRVLVVAGAGSGKTEIMARRVAWWVGVESVPKEKIVAFTFTERAAEEMKFRIRSWIQKITPEGQDVALGDMYIGTIHGFCIAKTREFWPDDYHNYDILDEGGRAALILRGFNTLLGLKSLREALGPMQGQYATLESFTQAYDQLHEHNRFEIRLPSEHPPFHLGEGEREWCKQAELSTNVGESLQARAFAVAAARYYAYLRCRRFLDFSTSQTEFIRRLVADPEQMKALADGGTYLLVDELQDINPVQQKLIELLVGKTGKLTAVGDHRQAIYGFRGAKVEIIGRLWEAFKKESNSEVIDLQENFRSTPRIIDLANRWAESISEVSSMTTPPMRHGNKQRKDYHPSHVALIGFPDRKQEAEWIAEAIKTIVPSETKGATHDKRDGAQRGLALSDIAILVRSSTDVRTYMETLEAAGIPSVVRAGPDLFSQPEVLFFIAALGLTAGQTEYFGSPRNPKSMTERIQKVLGCAPTPQEVSKAAAEVLRASRLPLTPDDEARVRLAAAMVQRRITEEGQLFGRKDVDRLRTGKLRDFLTASKQPRRLFPQQLFHMLLSEAGVERWDTCEGRGQTAMFHLGALSKLITGIETPGWTSVRDYPYQIIGLCQYGADEGRTEEQPLMVRPEAITISTIHGVKGLEFAALFLADVNAQRFPSGMASRKVQLPLSGPIVNEIDVAGLSDNENHDGERRLMYVALTRAERFLLVSHSGSRTSSFIKELRGVMAEAGALVTANSKEILIGLKHLPKEYRRDIQLATSFSDLRYYLECPHDFYLRKVLGFAPTIDQAFGYGRGVHNLLRAIHSNPKKWAELSRDRASLEAEIQKLIDRGLFYLRYTTGDPADNMRGKGRKVVADYVARYASELAQLEFDPERAFETLVEYGDGEGGALISGAIDIVRQDDPPRVTLIDFKSGDPEADAKKLDEDEMRLQVAIYALAAKKELQYQPEQGLVRYLDVGKGEKDAIEVPLKEEALAAAKSQVAETARSIRDRKFNSGPKKAGADGKGRCGACDFLCMCGMKQARTHRATPGAHW
jgi:DNA helicase-2/ATP-dependent DNA helicase PcrA